MNNSVESWVPIKEYSICKKGDRAVVIALPLSWLKFANAKSGDKIRLYQRPGSNDLLLKLVKDEQTP